MSVSYMTNQAFKPHDYVAPVSLDLLANVLSQKQGKFDANAEKIQNNINTIASLDVLKGADKEYINTKVNNLVSTINGIGGQDISDPNISNQIDGLATSVYSDERVLNAVSSTKKIRSLQASYDKMKSDPKLMKYFSDANYIVDMKSVNAYVGSKDPNSTYQGNSTATPFEDYNEFYVKNLKDIKANKVVQLSNGMYADKSTLTTDKNGDYQITTTTKFITEREVQDIAKGLLNPKQQAQMARDAYYTYGYRLEGLGPQYQKEYLVTKATEHTVAQIKDFDSQIERYNILLKQEGSIGETKKIIEANIKSLAASKLEAEDALRNNSKHYSDLFDKAPTELMTQIYSNEYFTGIGKKYAFKEEDIKKVADPYKFSDYKFKQAQILQQEKLAGMKELMEAKNRLGKPGIEPNPIPQVTPDTTPETAEERGAIAGNASAALANQANTIRDNYGRQVLGNSYNPNSTTNPLDVAHETLTAAATGKPYANTKLQKGLGDVAEQHDLANFGASGYRVVSSDEQFQYKQKGSYAITDDIEKNPKTGVGYTSIKNRIVTHLNSDAEANRQLTVDNITFSAIGPSKKQFNPDGTPDNSVEVSFTYKTKKGTFSETIPLTQIELASIGYVAPTSSESVLNNLVDKKRAFTTNIQSDTNPNIVARISTIQVDGGYQTYINYDGQTIPLYSGGQLPTTAALAYNNAKTLIKKADSKEYIHNLVKNIQLSVSDNNPYVDFSSPIDMGAFNRQYAEAMRRNQQEELQSRLPKRPNLLVPIKK